MSGNSEAGSGPVKRSAITRVEKLLFLSCALLIIIYLVASFFPQLRLWGINQLGYFPLSVRFVLCAVGLMVLIPSINGILSGILNRAFCWMANRLKGINRYMKYSIASILSLCIFWLLKVKTPLLGDGYLRAGELKLGVLLEITEPLDFYLHLLIYRLSGLDGYTTYAVVSCIAGAALVYLILLLGDLWGRNGTEKLLVFSILTGMGYVQLFFGYVESYSLMFVFLVSYVLFGLRYLKGKTSFLGPCLFLLLAGGFHFSAFFALPSLFYLAFVRRHDDSERGTSGFEFAHGMYLGGMIFIIAIAIHFLKTYAIQKPPGSILIHPFGGVESLYSFFSRAHWLDFINELILVSPIGLLLLIVFVVSLHKRIDFKDKIVRFLLILTLCLFIFAVFVDPKLGYARDWDLFAFSGLGITLLGCYLLLGIIRTEKGVKLSRVTLALVITTLIFSFPWILINASEHRAIERFENLLKVDKQRSAHGYEILACYFRDKGEHDKTVELWKKAIAANPLPRYFASLGNACSMQDENEQAIEAYHRALETGMDLPSVPGVYNNIGNTLARMGRYDEAASYMERAINLRPNRADYYFNLGNILGKAKRYEEAIPCFKAVIELEPRKAPAYKLLGITYAMIGEREKAKESLEKYLRFMPKDGSQIKGIIDSIQIEMEYDR